MSNEVIQTRVPNSLYRQFKKIAESANRSIANLARIAVEEFVERNKNGNQEESKKEGRH